MLLQLGSLDLLSFLLDSLRLGQFDWIPVIKSVVLRVRIYMITTLWSGLTVVIDFEEATFNLFSVHFDKSSLSTLMCLEEDVGEAFRLLSLPVVSNTNGFDLAEATESITNIVFLEGVRETLDEEGLALSWHQTCHFYKQKEDD